MVTFIGSGPGGRSTIGSDLSLRRNKTIDSLNLRERERERERFKRKKVVPLEDPS